MRQRRRNGTRSVFGHSTPSKFIAVYTLFGASSTTGKYKDIQQPEILRFIDNLFVLNDTDSEYGLKTADTRYDNPLEMTTLDLGS
jgi:hypothetical protein